MSLGAADGLTFRFERDGTEEALGEVVVSGTRVM